MRWVGSGREGNADACGVFLVSPGRRQSGLQQRKLRLDSEVTKASERLLLERLVWQGGQLQVQRWSASGRLHGMTIRARQEIKCFTKISNGYRWILSVFHEKQELSFGMQMREGQGWSLGSILTLRKGLERLTSFIGENGVLSLRISRWAAAVVMVWYDRSLAMPSVTISSSALATSFRS